jgi:hypothetical protein
MTAAMRGEEAGSKVFSSVPYILSRGFPFIVMARLRRL